MGSHRMDDVRNSVVGELKDAQSWDGLNRLFAFERGVGV
jgi:hypothetical protein